MDEGDEGSFFFTISPALLSLVLWMIAILTGAVVAQGSSDLHFLKASEVERLFIIYCLFVCLLGRSVGPGSLPILFMGYLFDLEM